MIHSVTLKPKFLKKFIVGFKILYMENFVHFEFGMKTKIFCCDLNLPKWWNFLSYLNIMIVNRLVLLRRFKGKDAFLTQVHHKLYSYFHRYFNRTAAFYLLGHRLQFPLFWKKREIPPFFLTWCFHAFLSQNGLK